MNKLLTTDGYKFGHPRMYHKHVVSEHSQLLARIDSQFDETPFLGLQPILRELVKPVGMTL